MDRNEAYAALADALRRVAPEVSLADVDHDADLLEELELDSMDLLSLVTELHQRVGVEISESDYPRLSSVNSAVTFLEERSR